MTTPEPFGRPLGEPTQVDFTLFHQPNPRSIRKNTGVVAWRLATSPSDGDRGEGTWMRRNTTKTRIPGRDRAVQAQRSRSRPHPEGR